MHIEENTEAHTAAAAVDLLRGMEDAAREAGRVLLAQATPRRPATWEEWVAVFASAEKPAATLLTDRLEQLVPGAPWREELDPDPVGTQTTWVVDVIDGAVQYVRGLMQWCVSITLVDGCQPRVAVLHSPVLGQTFSAARGAGAFLDGERLQVSGADCLDVAVVATSQPPVPSEQPGVAAAAGQTLSALLPHVAAVRNLGPTSWQIGDVAAGRLDGFWLCGRDTTNLLGASLIAAEAGARLTDLQDRPWSAAADDFLVAAPSLHPQLLAHLRSRAGEDQA